MFTTSHLLLTILLPHQLVNSRCLKHLTCSYQSLSNNITSVKCCHHLSIKVIKSPQHLTSYSAPQHLRCSQQLTSSSTSYPLTPHHLSIKLIKAAYLCNSSSVLRHQSESPLQDGKPKVKTSTPRQNIVSI